MREDMFDNHVGSGNEAALLLPSSDWYVWEGRSVVGRSVRCNPGPCSFGDLQGCHYMPGI
jgi:hypothetical protein